MIQQITTPVSRATTWVLVTLTIPVQCLSNHRFGERTLTLWRILIASVLIPIIGLPWIGPVRFDLPHLSREAFLDWSLPITSIRALLIVIMLWHWVDIQARKARGEVWHSKSLGIPWPWLGQDGQTQRLFVQPALAVVVGDVFWLLNNKPIASYFFVVAVLQVAGWWLIYHGIRNRLLEAADQQIEASTMRTLGSRGPLRKQTGDPIEQVLTPAERNNAPELAEILSTYQILGS